MSLRIEAGAQPIPGYQLVKRLGQGGCGEVWQAQAPGGFPKAIKFVPGTVAVRNATQFIPASVELKALQRLQTIRHPFLLSLERYDIRNGQLIIVTELADHDLAHRLEACQAQGLPGIPRDELLRYLEEAAEVLDLMNTQYGLQHLDIKPRNLFLVQKHVKVADFGLVKDLEAIREADDGGGTPAYTAPERFLGGMSRYCDQYSLAVVYQELLTGKLPFQAETPSAWRRLHVHTAPDVTPLPEADRVIVGKALAKRPNGRYRSCQELVRALREAGALAAASPKRESTLPPPGLMMVECPDCRNQERVPEMFRGLAFRCPRCTNQFRVQEPPPPALPEDIPLAPTEEEPPAADLAPEVLVEVRCPRCRHQAYVTARNARRKLRCRKCQTVFQSQRR